MPRKMPGICFFIDIRFFPSVVLMKCTPAPKGTDGNNVSMFVGLPDMDDSGVVLSVSLKVELWAWHAADMNHGHSSGQESTCKCTMRLDIICFIVWFARSTPPLDQDEPGAVHSRDTPCFIRVFFMVSLFNSGALSTLHLLTCWCLDRNWAVWRGASVLFFNAIASMNRCSMS